MARKRKPYDPWTTSNIQEVFNLPVSSTWLITWIKDTGIKTEAKGGIRFQKGYRLYYRLRAIPEVTYSADSISLTWLYAWDSDHYPTGKSTWPCILWKVTELTGPASIQVNAYCNDEVFDQQFYQLIEKVKESSRKKASAIEPTIVDQVMQSNVSPTVVGNGSNTSGRPTLLCNLWAYAETLLGRNPDLEEWKKLYALERGRDSDHRDPGKSMKESITALKKKYRV